MKTIVLLLCLVFSVVLLRIEARSNRGFSKALWLPTLWAMISGSRPVIRWLSGENQQALAADYGGSLPDRLVLFALIGLSFLVVASRQNVNWSRVWEDNWIVFLFFAFMGISVIWSDVPFVSAKRWIRSSGVVMAGLVVMSEKRPLQALESVFRRCAYVLVPLSLVLIKYFPTYGRQYGRWTGLQMWTGVATHKNGLGLLCAVTVLFFVNSLLTRKRRLDSGSQSGQGTADLFILFVALYLLFAPPGDGYSATAILITVVGSVMLLFVHRFRSAAAFLVSHLRMMMISLVFLYFTVGNSATAMVAAMLNRRADLTGRATGIWPLVLEEAAKHPILGSGYGGAWGLGGGLTMLTEGLAQGHNGYLDIYLELGIVGCVLLFMLFMVWGHHIRKLFKSDSTTGAFAACFLVLTLLYNLSESGFFDFYLSTAMVFLPLAISGELMSRESSSHRTEFVPMVHQQVGWTPNFR